MVDVAEDDVAQTATVDGVLGGQGDAADANDDDNERVETTRRHQAMDVPAYTVNETASAYITSGTLKLRDTKPCTLCCVCLQENRGK